MKMRLVVDTLMISRWMPYAIEYLIIDLDRTFAVLQPIEATILPPIEKEVCKSIQSTNGLIEYSTSTLLEPMLAIQHLISFKA